MEEGQLKKRIDQIVHLKIENDDAHCVTCGVKYDPKLKPQNYMISSEGMKNWIDEAKQECPTYEVAKIVYFHRVQKIEITSGLDEAGVQQILASLWGEWFVKWFGTEEVKKSE